MQNYIMHDEKIMQIPFGIFYGVERFSRYPNGEVQSLSLSEKNVVCTEAGELIPAYTQNERRKNKPSVEFSKEGLVTSVALEEQQEVVTPIGELPAEYIKFYDTGELHRIHILDGQISGFWTIDEERAFNIPLSFDLEFARFTAMLDGLCFYKSGDIKSITLFPGEQILVNSPLGEIRTEVGVSLYESGKLKSVEPAGPVMIPTPIGKIMAYDTGQTGIHAESNSLAFTEDGKLKAFATCDNAIYVQTEEETLDKFMPKVKMHPLYDDQLMAESMKVIFDYEKDEVTIQGRKFLLSRCGFTVVPFTRPEMHCSLEDCASCSLCNKN